MSNQFPRFPGAMSRRSLLFGLTGAGALVLMGCAQSGDEANAMLYVSRAPWGIYDLLDVNSSVCVPITGVAERMPERLRHLVYLDGVVLAGTGAVNEAAITGESLPAEKAPKSVRYELFSPNDWLLG